MTDYVALLRGINVGKAKRIAMADLRSLVTDLGYTNVRTLLNSGNVVFSGKKTSSRKLGQRIQEAVASKLGVSCEVVVVTGAVIAQVVGENLLKGIADNPSRYLVAFVSELATLKTVEPLLSDSWGDERLAIGLNVGYVWCPNEVHKSKLFKALNKISGEAATSRNWSTVLKLHTMLFGD